ncbi:MAG: MOSC domain-containing protein [Planctomycetes bacterium]|nr:MOSC domain-containing protein [Planctomycetota bacterium]
MAHVVSIVYRPKGTGRPQDRYARVPTDRVQLIEAHGIEGDRKAGSKKRQLNVMLAETLAELGQEGFKVGPGELGEQIVISGVDPAALVEGARIKLGAAVIEVGEPRTGCDRFEMIQGKPRHAAKGRLGTLARVIVGGAVAVGDPVEVLTAD